MGLLDQMNRSARQFLIKTWQPLMVATITLGVLPMAATFRLIWPLGLMAAVGAILDHAQEREGRDRDNRNRMTSDLAEVILRAVLASRSQPPADQALHLVAAAKSQSAPPPPRRSAG